MQTINTFLSNASVLYNHGIELPLSSVYDQNQQKTRDIRQEAAIAMVHVGRTRIRRAATDAQRHRRALVFFGLGLLLIVAGIPWPFLPYGRPWVSWP